MNLSMERIEAEAMKLPPRERAHLAHVLITSLDADWDDDPAEAERAWAEEIQRRLDEYRVGVVQPVSSFRVFAEAWAMLHEQECACEDAEGAWIAEAERRLKRYLAGEMEAIPAAGAMARVRNRLSRIHRP